MEISLLIKRGDEQISMKDIVKGLISPFIETFSEDLRGRAGIWLSPIPDFSRKANIFMTTDPERSLPHTYTGKDGEFEYVYESGLWRWVKCK